MIKEGLLSMRGDQEMNTQHVVRNALIVDKITIKSMLTEAMWQE